LPVGSSSVRELSWITWSAACDRSAPNVVVDMSDGRSVAVALASASMVPSPAATSFRRWSVRIPATSDRSRALSRPVAQLRANRQVEHAGRSSAQIRAGTAAGADNRPRSRSRRWSTSGRKSATGNEWAVSSPSSRCIDGPVGCPARRSASA
jgi:hypothetical protein